MKKTIITPDEYPWPTGVVVSGTPVRRIHTRSRRRNTALVYSTLPLGMREVESSIEERFVMVAQLDPGVTRLRAQPCWLRVLEAGRIRRRAPDFALMYRRAPELEEAPELHETKQDAECWTADVASELLAIREEVERHPPWRYSVSLESALLAEPLRSNTDLLWRYLRPDEQIDFDMRLRVGEVLDEGQRSATDLIEQVVCRGGRVTWHDLLALAAGRYIDFDVDVALTPESVFWNCHSGPPRRRTVPFGTVEAAIAPPVAKTRLPAFLSLQLRGVRL